MRRVTSLVGWLVVVLVGLGVLGLVFGFSLFPRISAGQRVIDKLGPAFTSEAAAGDRAGINYLSTAVDTFQPVVTDKGGAAAEVPKLIGFVSAQTGLSQAQVVGALQTNFPHAAGLLQALPLSSVTNEVPGLVQFLATTLKTTPDQVMAALKQNFPAIYQAVTALPTVTKGWDAVPGTEGLTRFDGKPVTNVSDVRSYFSEDVIPVVEKHTTDMGRLANWWPKVTVFPPLLAAIGALATLLGVVMLVYTSRSRNGRKVGIAAWTAVLLVGAVVYSLVFALGLYARFGGGANMLKDATPIFTEARLAGDQASISYVSSIVDMGDPIMTEKGGAAAEVPKLVAFVSAQTGLSQAQVLSALKTNFPHTTALLQAVPLSAVTQELPKLVQFLATTLKTTPEGVNTALATNFPHVAQAIAGLPKVTEGWYNVPGSTPGSQMSTAAGVRDYFAKTVVPGLVANKGDFRELNGHWPPLDLVAPLLVLVGLVVAIWGALFLVLTIRSGKESPEHAGAVKTA